MTTPGATEAVTPEQRAEQLLAFINFSTSQAGRLKLLTEAIREAEANALRRSVEPLAKLLKPGELELLCGEVTASERRLVRGILKYLIRSLLPKEEGK